MRGQRRLPLGGEARFLYKEKLLMFNANSIISALKNAPLDADAVLNIGEWLFAENLPKEFFLSIKSLVEAKNWTELNERFYKKLSFGTGGLRGRVVAKNPTSVELPAAGAAPKHPAAGSNCLNYVTVLKATLGLFNYCKKHFDAKNPRLLVSYDTRFFSEEFARMAASMWANLGGEAYMFGGARPTPQLSYTIPQIGAHAGVMITASHNPYYDNGYKVYDENGAQMASQKTKLLAEFIGEVSVNDVSGFLDSGILGAKILPAEAENSYIDSLSEALIEPDSLRETPPKIVYTPLHGTGAAVCPRVMERFGIPAVFVEAQMKPDGAFATVKSPNPEDSSAMEMGIKIAEDCGADALIATDPDSDRMGVAVKSEGGKFGILSGNEVGIMLAAFRLERMKALGLMEDPENCVVLKSFITSPLIEKICGFYGVRCVNTLTGFKYIGERICLYEKKFIAENGCELKDRYFKNRARMFQKHSSFFVLGAEESLGYLGTDSTKDKDANSALLMFAELLAYLKKNGLSAREYLVEIFKKYSFVRDFSESLRLESVADLKRAKNILFEFGKNPPKKISNLEVSEIVNFSDGGISDADGERLPKENFYMLKFADGSRVGVRASGTEPKIKFYISIAGGKAGSADDLDSLNARSREKADAIFRYFEGVFA